MLSLLAVVCPPLAVLLISTPSRALGNLGLTLLFYVPGVLDALRVVDRYTVNRRYEAVMRALSLQRT